jgi:hypothetical protein
VSAAGDVDAVGMVGVLVDAVGVGAPGAQAQRAAHRSLVHTLLVSDAPAAACW